MLLQRLVSKTVGGKPKLRRASKSCGASLATTNTTDNDLRKLALEHLALLLLQEGQRTAAEAILKSEGYTHTFADCVVRYVVPNRPAETTGSRRRVIAANTDADKCVRVYSDALPPHILKTLQTAFAANSSFWSEHNYFTTTIGGEKKCGYFSYAHPAAEQSSASNIIQQVAAHALNLYRKDFPALSECKFIEWWAHCRPHSDGHQMHFDSDDEGVGGVRNPIASAVIYLSTTALGGPTLVTTQRLGDTDVAHNGWLVHPLCNAMAMFDGKLLHGVIPGHSLPPKHARAAKAPDADAPVGGAASARFSLPMGPRRVTLMVAFWRQLRLRPFCKHAPCAAQRFPSGPAASGITWPTLLAATPESVWATETAPPRSVAVQPVAPIWSSMGDRGAERIPAYSDCFQYPQRP